MLDDDTIEKVMMDKGDNLQLREDFVKLSVTPKTRRKIEILEAKKDQIVKGKKWVDAKYVFVHILYIIIM